MTPADVHELLTMANVLERRTGPAADVSRVEATAWAGVLTDVDLPDARTALTEHYRTSTWPIKPADVREGVARLRAARLDALPLHQVTPPPGMDADDVAGWIAWQRETTAAIAAGHITPTTVAADTRALSAGPPPDVTRVLRAVPAARRAEAAERVERINADAEASRARQKIVLAAMPDPRGHDVERAHADALAQNQKVGA